MKTPYRILIFGASYGSLLGIKLVLAGHKVTLVCLPEEAQIINQEGIKVRLPVKGLEAPVVLESKRYPGLLNALTPAEAKPKDYDLVALAMQEPQFAAASVRELLDRVAKAKVPCMSIMNMPPLPYLAHIPGLNLVPLRAVYTEPSVWDNFDPNLMTLCSPDPQAFRPPEEKLNFLHVGLPTNFKVARFKSDAHTEMLRSIQADIEAIQYDTGKGTIELPVKLKVHDSIFVPLAKWCMLMTGNYRCVQKDGMHPIKESVHADLERSRALYTWVSQLCQNLGAKPEDMVPFEKYAAAANGLLKPSSAARALYGGAKHIERVDALVQAIAAQKGMKHKDLDETVKLVDAQLELNRKKTA